MRPKVALSILIVVCLATANRAAGEPGEVVFVPVRPCRLIDTRDALGIQGPLVPGAVNRFFLGGLCGLPGMTGDGGSEVNRARALALNIIAVSPTGFGHITAWPTNQPMPATSVINYSPGQNTANGVIVPMCDEEIPNERGCPFGDISFLVAVSPAHLVVDVTGYYVKPVQRDSARHGAGVGADRFLCVNSVQSVRFGLSSQVAQRADADRLCPAGTWVCTQQEVGTVGCDTTRPDSACDRRTCAGACVDDPAVNHRGWTDGTLDPFGTGVTVNEAGVGAATAVCEIHPAWCCSRN